MPWCWWPLADYVRIDTDIDHNQVRIYWLCFTFFYFDGKEA